MRWHDDRVPNSPAEWIIILVVVLLLFGGSQLPKLARNLGEAQREFKKGLSEGMKKSDDEKSEKSEKSETSAKDDSK